MDITDVASWTTPVPVIDDGDPLSNAEFLATAQALANRTARIAQFVPGLPGNKTFALPLAPRHNQDDRFTQVLSSEHFYWSQDATTVGGFWLDLPLLPVGARLISAQMRWTGAINAGTHTTLPSTMPAIAVLYQDDLADTTIATQSDTSILAAYDTPHDVVVTLNHDIVGSPRQYFIKITGETGGTIGTGNPGLLAVYYTLGPVP